MGIIAELNLARMLKGSGELYYLQEAKALKQLVVNKRETFVFWEGCPLLQSLLRK